MRKLAFALAICVLSAGPSLAQQQTAWADKLFMNKTSHDFGSVARGTQLKFSFPLKNIYAVDLEITNLRVSCGCVTPKASKKLLKSQEEGTIEITMDAWRFSGPKTVYIYVTVGPEYISTATLKVTANARTDVVFNPGEFNFGVIAQGQQPEQKMDVEYVGSLDFRIKEVVKPADAPFSVAMQELYRPSPGKAGKVVYRMTVKLNADAPGGPFKHELTLKTNDPASESLTVTVEGNIQAALRAAPSNVVLGTLKVSEARNFKVLVQGNRPFRITEVKSDGPEITAELPQQASTVHTLNLRCTPAAVGDLRRQVTIITDMDKGASVTVTVQGTAK